MWYGYLHLSAPHWNVLINTGTKMSYDNILNNSNFHGKYD